MKMHAKKIYINDLEGSIVCFSNKRYYSKTEIVNIDGVEHEIEIVIESKETLKNLLNYWDTIDNVIKDST